MTVRSTRPALAIALAAALASPAPARAHEFTLESVASGFVAIRPGEAHLVVRVPLHLLRDARFPVRGREIALDEAGPAIDRALAIVAREIPLWEGSRVLAPGSAAGRIALPSDRSFDGYASAAAGIARPPSPGTAVYADQGFLDAHLVYPIASADGRFSVRTALAPELGESVKLALRFLPPGEDGRPMLITRASGRVALNPSWLQAGAGFVALGIGHILGGIDHLLFLLCLVIPLVRFRQVLPVVTAFTAAHSLTLVGSAYGLAPAGAWFPPFVETAIAASIVYMAIENVVGADVGRRWLVAGLFGLVHGFGFSYGLQENLQFAGRHLLVSLFAFNVGIEIGQLAVLAALLPALALLRRVLDPRKGAIVLSVLVGHTAWHWMTARGEVLWRTEWPRLDGAAIATLARWVAGILLAAAAVRLASRAVASRRAAAGPGGSGATGPASGQAQPSG